MNIPAPLPKTCGVAFKEWAGICRALADGRQTLILRKGGIEEGPGGFVPEHPAFWLYPTYVHQAEQGLKSDVIDENSSGDPSVVRLSSIAVIERIGRVETLEALHALDPFHVWTEETVKKRFHYRSPGLWVLAVRVYNAPAPAEIRVTAEQLGCKTWVFLEQPISTSGATTAMAAGRFAETSTLLSPLLDRIAT